MLFDDPGIPAATKARVNALSAAGRLPQSVLLSGGSAKLREKCALELVSAVMCTELKDGVPCGKCAACRELKAGTHPDLTRVIPEKDRKNVSIDVVRTLVTDTLYQAPNAAENKAYLFPDAQDLSVLIQNALLKTVEEPPPFAMFVFLCDQRDKLLPTVISRLTEFPLGDVLTAERKTKEAQITETAEGFVRALCRGTEYDIMKSTAPMTKNRQLMKKTAERVILYVRDAAAYGTGDVLGGSEEAAQLLYAAFGMTELFRLKDAMEQISAWAASNANENLLQTLFSCMAAGLLEKRKHFVR